MTQIAPSRERTAAMRLGGKKLGQVKAALRTAAVPGVSFEQLESLAQKLIADVGCKPSFSTVPGYSWATCIMKNDELCHGIPKNKIVETGDVITIDVGLLQDGYHLDTTITFGVGELPQKAREFVAAGARILSSAIAKARVGSSVYDVSNCIETELHKRGYGAVYQLTGHGVGEELHMEPSIPCVADKSDKRHLFYEGQTVAIEVMYAMGKPHLELARDGWTYQTKDGSITGMFEETVLITKQGPEILTLS